MAEGVATDNPRFVRTLVLLLLAGVGIRLAAAIVAGFIEWHSSSLLPYAVGRARAFDVLSTFGSAGDGTGVLLVALAAAAVWWSSRLGDARAAALQLTAAWLFGVTALLAVANGVGFGFLYSIDSQHQTARLVQVEGDSLAYVVIAVAGVLVMRWLMWLVDEQTLEDDQLDAFVFAVDRATGDVRAFMSVGDARRGMSVYSVEDNEFAFYTDEGEVLEASAVEGRITLRPTGQDRFDDLLTALKEFANRRGVKVNGEDADDPTAYAVPINRWRWLEMWPPWMRPIGMLFRRNR